jgi:predicted ester cyclase
LKNLVLWHHKHCPGFTLTILNIMAEGDKVMAHIQYEMTYSVQVDPPEMGVYPFGKPVSWRNMNVFTLRDGMIVAQNPVTGMTDALIEAGAIPSPDKVVANKAAVVKFADAINRKDAALLTEICTPETAKGWIDALPGVYANMKDHHIELSDMVADGESVAVKLSTSGYHTGEMHGLPASGKWWTNRVFAFVRFTDGKIAEVDLQPDVENVIQQIGGIIKPVTA